MIRPAFILAVCLAASSAIALADETCPPITNLVPTGAVTYTAYPCAPVNLFDSQVRCTNCPPSQVFLPQRQGQPMCFRSVPDYVSITEYRHVKNGKCVPFAGSLDQKRTVPKQIPTLAGPLAPGAPPRIAPVHAPAAMHAPPAMHAAPARVGIPHITTAPARPQPTKPI